MKVEIPELKRCCFCIPLRYGLIAWGYIKLVPMLLTLGAVVYAVVYLSMRSGFVGEIVMLSLLLLVLTLDICLTVVFLVGGHRKLAKLLHIYYIYNITALCLYVAFFTWSMAMELYYMSHHIDRIPNGYFSVIPVIQMRLLSGIFVMGIQAYIIILIRSEVTKLRNSSKYRFSNPTADIEGTLENGINEQEINYPKEESNEKGTDSQFEGIINQTKKTSNESFNYNKL